MSNEIKKYYIEDTGSFVILDDKGFNDLAGYELPLSVIPGILYLKPGYEILSNEILFSHKELKSILQTTIHYSIN
jgi:hypothetical protein